jgi:hypothetical protein
MLKFCKGIFSSALFVVLLIPFSLTSCAKNKNSNLDYSSPYADFINERTFSMLCVVPNIEPGKIGYIAGTGWLFKKSINADYEYYLATNLHVSASYPYYSTAGKSVSF